MKLATKGLVLEGLNTGEKVDFSDIENVEQLKFSIVNNYVVLCRHCASEKFCKFSDRTEPPCPILEKVVNNYVDMNIKSVKTDNQYHLREFIKSVILLIRIFNLFENWRGTYVDEWFNWYFESIHPRLNSTFAFDLLVDISKYVKAYRVVETDREKRFVVFVEGTSEFVALPPIFKALGVSGIELDSRSSLRFINLEGKDNIQKDKIKMNLSKFREDDISYFIILDNDLNVKSYFQDLKRVGLIEDSQYIIWNNKFEDNFGEEAILKVLNEEAKEVFGKIDIKELKRYNFRKHDIGKSIEHLMKDKGTTLKFDDYKVCIAKGIADWVCREIKDSERSLPVYDTTKLTSKSFPEFVERLKKITEEIKKLNSEFHVIK